RRSYSTTLLPEYRRPGLSEREGYHVPQHGRIRWICDRRAARPAVDRVGVRGRDQLLHDTALAGLLGLYRLPDPQGHLADRRRSNAVGIQGEQSRIVRAIGYRLSAISYQRTAFLGGFLLIADS